MTSNADWFAKKLSQQNPVQQGRPQETVPMPPSQQPMSPFPQFQPAQSDITRLAPSSSSTETCPECNSGNYMSPGQQIGKRCYDCGYPISQSGSRYGNLQTARVEGGITQATGNNATNNWNPQGIIGRIQ